MIRIYRIIGAVLLQGVFIIGMILTYTNILTNGYPVLMPIRGVDPRDFFRGDYIVLDYPLSTVQSAATSGVVPFVSGQPIYALLSTGAQGSDYGSIVSELHGLSTTRPSSGLYTKATVQSTYTQAQYQYAVRLIGDASSPAKRSFVTEYELTDPLKMILVRKLGNRGNLTYLAQLPREIGLQKSSSQQGSLTDQRGQTLSNCEQMNSVTGEILYVDDVSQQYLKKMLVKAAINDPYSNGYNTYENNALEFVIYPYDPGFSGYTQGQTINLTQCVGEYSMRRIYLNNYYASPSAEIRSVLDIAEYTNPVNQGRQKPFQERDLSRLRLADDLELTSMRGTNNISLHFGVDRFFVQKGSGKAIEDALRGTGQSYAMRKIGSNGTIVVEGLIVDGKEIY